RAETRKYSRCLLVPRIEIITGAGGRGARHVVRTRAAMRPPAPARIALAATAAFIVALAAIDLRLRTRDEGGQSVDTVCGRRLRLLRLRLVLRLRTVLALMIAIAAMLARLLLVALIGLLVAVALVVVAHIGLLRLLLLRHEARLLAERREAVVTF